MVTNRTIPVYDSCVPRSDRLDTEHGANALIDGSQEWAREFPDSFVEPRTIDQLKTYRNRDAVFRQAGDGRGEEDIAGKPRTVEICGEGHDMCLPDLDSEHIVRAHHDTRSPLVQRNPIELAAPHHGAERSIRLPVSRAVRPAQRKYYL